MASITLDKTDLKILQVLQENGRLTNVELSERVALSPSPCLRRLKQLEDAGIIRKYAALLSAFRRLSAYPSARPRLHAKNFPPPYRRGRRC